MLNVCNIWRFLSGSALTWLRVRVKLPYYLVHPSGYTRRRCMVQLLDNRTTKCGFATRAVPLERMARMVPMSGATRIGDLVAGEVLSVGKNTRLEVRREVQLDLFPGDVV